MAWQHGTAYGYVKKKCKCRACTEWNRRRQHVSTTPKAELGPGPNGERRQSFTVDDCIDEIALALHG